MYSLGERIGLATLMWKQMQQWLIRDYSEDKEYSFSSVFLIFLWLSTYYNFYLAKVANNHCFTLLIIISS